MYTGIYQASRFHWGWSRAFRSQCAGSGGSESDDAILFRYGHPEPARLISGNRDEPRRVKERGQVLKGRDLSSLAIELVQSGHSDKMSSLSAFMGALRPKGAVINKHAGRRSQTGCGRVGRGAGMNREILWRPEKGH